MKETIFLKERKERRRMISRGTKGSCLGIFSSFSFEGERRREGRRKK